MKNEDSVGSLACVGLGMMLGAHLTPRSKSHIENADLVFTLVSNGLVEAWVSEMNPNIKSLQPFYVKGQSRNISYKNMVNAIREEVQLGKRVVAAFYGHPGVFAKVPHEALKAVRELGASVVMEPGISAEDCLFADLSIDPGKYGCQQYEASQFMFYERVVDTSAYLILWQVGVVGDKSLALLNTNKPKVRLFVELLKESYPSEHEVILYEAKVMPFDQVRAQKVSLDKLEDIELNQHTTLVIPPCKKMVKNEKILSMLSGLDNHV